MHATNKSLRINFIKYYTFKFIYTRIKTRTVTRFECVMKALAGFGPRSAPYRNNICSTRSSWKCPSKRGRRSGWKEEEWRRGKTKTLRAVRHVVFRTHERISGRVRGFIQADPEHLNTEMQLISSDLGSFRDALGFYRGIQFIRLYNIWFVLLAVSDLSAFKPWSGFIFVRSGIIMPLII